MERDNDIEREKVAEHEARYYADYRCARCGYT